jgi:hypothetical protein
VDGTFDAPPLSIFVLLEKQLEPPLMTRHSPAAVSCSLAEL